MNKFNIKTVFVVILIIIFIIGLFLLLRTSKPVNDNTTTLVDKEFLSFFGNRKLKKVDETTVPGVNSNNKYNPDGTLNPNYDPTKDATDNLGTGNNGSNGNGTGSGGNGTGSTGSNGSGSGGSLSIKSIGTNINKFLGLDRSDITGDNNQDGSGSGTRGDNNQDGSGPGTRGDNNQDGSGPGTRGDSDGVSWKNENNVNIEEGIKIDCTPKSIEFTPEEIERLKILKERFYKVSAEIRTEEDLNTLIRTRQNYYDYLSSDYAKTSSVDYTKSGVAELTKQCFDERAQAIKVASETIVNDRKKITESINKIIQDISDLENGISIMNTNLQINIEALDDNDYFGRDYSIIDGVKITKKVINANISKLKSDIQKDTKKLNDLKLEKEKKTNELNGLSLSGRPIGMRLNPFITKSSFEELLKNPTIKAYFTAEINIFEEQIKDINNKIKILQNEKNDQQKIINDDHISYEALNKAYKIYNQKNRDIIYLNNKLEKLKILLDMANNDKFLYLSNNVSYIKNEPPSKKETELSRKNRIYTTMQDIFWSVFNGASAVLDKIWGGGDWSQTRANPLVQAGFTTLCESEKKSNPDLIIVYGDGDPKKEGEDNTSCYERYYPMQTIERMLGIW